MPSMAEYSNNNSIKLLLIGPSGAGKTGALASLASKYKLRIADFDNGLDPLFHFTKPEHRKNVEYLQFHDKFKKGPQGPVPLGVPTAFPRFLDALDNWKDGANAYGSVYKWEPDTILVVDSLTHLSNAIMRYTLALVGRSGEQPWQSDWGDAMRHVEDLLTMLYSTDIKCHVLITAHVTYIENEDGTIGYPNALGAKLPPKVPSYFNSMLIAQNKGSGSAAKKVIRTVPSGLVGAKFPVPGAPPEWGVEDGLLQAFNLLEGKMK